MADWRRRLIAHINRRAWWHVPPHDPEAYEKRGKFYASSFAEAEFYGRPLDQPEKVVVTSPLVGDEATIERALFGGPVRHAWPDNTVYRRRISLDAKMKRAALAKGFDAIVLMTPRGFASYNLYGKFPRSIELNVLNTDHRSRNP